MPLGLEDNDCLSYAMASEHILAEMLLDEEDLFRYCDLSEQLQV
jgi:hypothetical protein